MGYKKCLISLSDLIYCRKENCGRGEPTIRSLHRRAYLFFLAAIPPGRIGGR